MMKKVLYFLFIGALTLPVLQYFFSFAPESKLQGTFEVKEKPEFNWSNWFDGKFQNDFDGFLDQEIGFRSFFIKNYNQVHYSLFDKTNAEKVVIGKDGVLFEDSYINSYLGLNLKKEAEIKEKLRKTAFVANALDQQGKKLVLLLAPDKTSYYPDKIPEKWHKIHQNTERENNYDRYSSLFADYEIDVLDFNKAFLEAKDTAQVALFPKAGIHWSNHASVKVIDSLQKYFMDRYDIALPKLIIRETGLTDVPINPDYDLGNLLNIYSKEAGLTRTCSVSVDIHNAAALDLLTIGDSFYWNLYHQGLIKDLFVKHEFWYYNHLVYPASFQKEEKVADLSIKDKLKEVDVVMILITSGALDNYAFGFIDQAYQELTLNKSYFKIVDHLKNKIRRDANWLSNVKQKAKEKGISLEAMLEEDAKYLMKELSQDEMFQLRSAIYKQEIRADAAWLEVIKDKAKEQGITLDQAIEMDVKYLIKKEDGQL